MTNTINQNTDNSNPLASYFRTPALYLELPSRGEHYPPGSIEMTENGELPILPMTARDEIALNTPDALMSGVSTVQVIESCVPNIKNGFEVPTIDIDAILIAIRIATYGEQMELTSVCPKCEHANIYEINLLGLLGQCKHIDFSKPNMIDGLTFYIKPQLFREVNKINLKHFTEQRAIDFIQNSNADNVEQTNKLNDYIKQVSMIAIDITSNFIEKIITTDGIEVIDTKHINEFISNCDKAMYSKIEDVIKGYSNQAGFDNVNMKCLECNTEYETPVEFETSNFFV